MNQFTLQWRNRRSFPDKHIIIVEDDNSAMLQFATLMFDLFPAQGFIDYSMTSSGIAAAAMVQSLNEVKVNGKNVLKLLILDHDLPYGTATNLINWMAGVGIINIPIITASGIPENNAHMKKIGEEFGMIVHEFQKPEVLEKKANQLILEILEQPYEE